MALNQSGPVTGIPLNEAPTGMIVEGEVSSEQFDQLLGGIFESARQSEPWPVIGEFALTGSIVDPGSPARVDVNAPGKSKVVDVVFVPEALVGAQADSAEQITRDGTYVATLSNRNISFRGTAHIVRQVTALQVVDETTKEEPLNNVPAELRIAEAPRQHDAADDEAPAPHFRLRTRVER